MRDQRTQIVACIVHYNNVPEANRLIREMATWSVTPDCCVVIDNSSNFQMSGINSAGSAITVEILDPGCNLGYAAAANLGVRRARGLRARHVILLTQDASLRHDCLAQLASTAASMSSTVTAPVLAFRSKPELIFSSGGDLSRRGRPSHRGLWDLIQSLDRSPREADWADGACLLIDLDLSRSIGEFSEEYFLYVEEIEFMLRVRLAGGRVVVDQRAIAYQEPGNFTSYLRARNLVYFRKKFRQEFGITSWMFAALREFVQALRRRSVNDILWGCRGIFDASRGRMGKPPTKLLAS